MGAGGGAGERPAGPEVWEEGGGGSEAVSVARPGGPGGVVVWVLGARGLCVLGVGAFGVGRVVAVGGASPAGPRFPPPPRLPARRPSPSPPFQVPSASRRGGLKTPRGPPVRPGSGAVGPLGSEGGRALGPAGLLPTDSARPPRPWGGGGGGSPRGACGVVSRGGASPPGRPVVETLPDPPESVLVSSLAPARGAPTDPRAPPWAGRKGGKQCRARCLAIKPKKLERLLAVDHSARASMKNAASCEN